MSSRGSGAGVLWFILILAVIGIVVEIVKMVVALVGMVLIAAVALVVIGIAIFGLGRFVDDVNNGRVVAMKCVIPLCIIGVCVLLGGPKLLGLFQVESGILWWHKIETNYFKLLLFIIFTTPLIFGLGYTISDMFYPKIAKCDAKIFLTNGINS